MDLNNLTLFAAIGSLVAFWQQIKGFILRVLSLVIRRDKISNYWLSECLLKEILPHTKLVRWGNSEFLSNNVYLPRQKFYGNLIFTYFKSYPALYKKAPIIISENGEQGISITYLAGTFPFAKLLEKISHQDTKQSEELFKKKANNFYIVELNGKDVEFNHGKVSEGQTALGSPVSESTGEKKGMLAHPHVLKNHGKYFGLPYSELEYIQEEEKNQDYFWSEEALRLDSEIAFWQENRNWYRERNIAWRRGALLSGKCGTGKSKMVIKCAEKHGICVRRLNISNMSNTEFLEAYNSGSNGETIVLIEDVDVCLVGRTNILADKNMSKQLVSFDTIINAIGGIKTGAGIFVILTTNHPEGLDSALTRAGRLDAKIEVGPLCENGRKFVASNILRDWKDLIEKTVRECDGFVAAEFENYCIELAIQEKTKEHMPTRKPLG